VLNSDANLVEKLIRKQKQPVDQLCHGKTALHLACEHKSKAVIERLLLARAKVDIPDDSGDTSLHILAQNYKADLWELLIPFAPDTINTKNKAGKTPVDLLPIQAQSAFRETQTPQHKKQKMT
jgi:ankyrin repeat protein